VSRAALAVMCLLGFYAEAAIYENVVEADDEEDILAAEQRGDIGSDTRDTLLELIREGIDLETASRDALYDLPSLTYADVDAILLYRAQKGSIADPAELVAAGAITEQQLLQIAPYVRIGAARTALPVGGRVRLMGHFMPTDRIAPPLILSGDFKGPFNLSAGGLIATTRRSLTPVRYDSFVDTLVSDGFTYLPHVPRAYLQWKNGDRRLVVGTFTIGFAERLVLDNTRRVTPRGIYLTNDFRRPTDTTRTCRLSSELDIINGECAGGEGNLYITPDFDWRDSFRGVAGSVENLNLGENRRLSMYGFFSFQGKSLYQYELYDRRTCDDPRNDNDANCKAPRVFQSMGSSTGDVSFVYSTLTYLFDELTAGGHVDFAVNDQLRFGITGYGAFPLFRNAGPMQLDFQEYSRYPNGGGFGAVGIDAKFGTGPFNFFLEAARSFDRAVGNNGGGWAIEQRSTFSRKGQELELSLRFYDNHFANPYTRAIAAPDEVDGQRARNELGARVRYALFTSKDWRLRSQLNFWVLPYANPFQGPAGMANLFGLVRFDLTPWPAFEPSLWGEMRNRNLQSTERGSCASGTVVLTEGEPLPCNGDSYRIAARLEFRPLGPRKLQLITQGALIWRDDIRRIFRDEQRFRQDVSAWAEVRMQWVDWLSIRLRSRYLFQDITDNTYLEQSLWSFLEVGILPLQGTRIAARYDLFFYLDQRASTTTRVPNPEHRFLLDVRTSF
jgi:hypothetical protein